jgi:dipeptidyl-peptidase-4
MIRGFFFTLALLIPALTFSQASPELSIEKIFRDFDLNAVLLGETYAHADGEHYSILENRRTIACYDYLTGKGTHIYFTADRLPDSIGYIDDFHFSKDESKILLTTMSDQIYRHSFYANYWIFDVETGKLTSLDESGKQQLALFSPDGSKVAYVKQNNLYFKDLRNMSTTRVTNDGAFNQIINGAPDWIYEEEFGFSRAFQWSPNSKQIAFYHFDESKVRQFDMVLFDQVYPSVNSFKYPKAGESNSNVNIMVYDLESGTIQTMQTGQESDIYVPRIKWSSIPGKVGIVTLNRLQNTVKVLLADAKSGISETIYEEENDRFISKIKDDYLVFTSDQKHFIILSEKSGYYHYYLYSITGKLVTQITRGNWEVNELLALDEKKGLMYYTSNESSAIQKDVYCIKLNGTGKRKLSSQPGSNDACFSSTFKYYISEWSNANTPPKYAVNIIDGSEVRIIEDNAELRNKIERYGFARKEFMKIPVSDSLVLNAYIIKPADFDSTRKYPLLMNVYGGPQSQDVTDEWDFGIAWQQFMAQKGIIVACVDNRGTDGRGEEFRKCTYLRLGILETEDQVNSAKYLGLQSWINKDEIGIWGWSYGGYMTLMCLTGSSGIFKYGIAVAPVSDWKFYGNIYTERYMRKPQENEKGYLDSSPINHAARLSGDLLMIHGTADDNVHVQNSVEMSQQLIKSGKQFRQFMYPDKDHSIKGGNTRNHLYSMMSDFILQHLQ